MHFTELSQHHRKGCQCISQNFHNITGRGANAFHRTFRTFTTSQEGCQCISQNFHNITGRGANAFHKTFRTFTTSQEGCQCISQNIQNFHNITGRVPMHFTELSELSQHHRKGANAFHRTFRTFTTSWNFVPHWQ